MLLRLAIPLSACVAAGNAVIMRSSCLTLALLALAACVQPAAPQAAEPRRPVASAVLLNTGLTEPVNLVIDNAEQWRLQWGRLMSNRRPEPALPAVDFKRDIVVVAALGRQSSGGFVIRIDRIEPGSNGTVLHVLVKEPGAGCINPAVLAAPADIVVLPRGVLPVQFAVARVREPCRQAQSGQGVAADAPAAG